MNYEPDNYASWDPKNQPFGMLMGSTSGAWGWRWYASLEDLKLDLIGEVAQSYELDSKREEELAKKLSAITNFSEISSLEGELEEIFFEGQNTFGIGVSFSTWDELKAGEFDFSQERLNQFYEELEIDAVYPLADEHEEEYLQYFKDNLSYSG